MIQKYNGREVREKIEEDPDALGCAVRENMVGTESTDSEKA